MTFDLPPRGVYRAAVRGVLYGCEPWPIRAVNTRELSVFGRQFLRSVVLV